MDIIPNLSKSLRCGIKQAVHFNEDSDFSGDIHTKFEQNPMKTQGEDISKYFRGGQWRPDADSGRNRIPIVRWSKYYFPSPRVIVSGFGLSQFMWNVDHTNSGHMKNHLWDTIFWKLWDLHLIQGFEVN